MNIQLKKDEVCCILPVNIPYDQVAAQLKTQGESTGITFCRRYIGADFLQWTLEDGGWEQLSKAAEPLHTQICKTFESYQNALKVAFGNNSKLAQAVLTTPSDDCILFRQRDGGNIEIALVAWGYKFPLRKKNVVITGHKPMPLEKQNVRLCFIYDGQLEKNKPFQLNGMERITTDDGFYYLGTHPVGTEFIIAYDNGHTFTLQVEKGRDLYEIDFTEFFTIEVIAHKDGEPYVNASCTISYHERNITLTTDADGHAFVEWPYCRDGAQCSAMIEGKSDIKQATKPKTVLCIDIETPKPIIEEPEPSANEAEIPTEEIEPPVEEQSPAIDPPNEEPKLVRFRLLGYKGMPLPELDFTIKTKNGLLKGKTDDDGCAVFPSDMFSDGEKPQIDFTITKEYKRKHDIYAKPPKK